MRHVRLSNGTVFNVTRCAERNGELYITVTDTTLVNAVNVFGDPGNVEVIEHYFDGTETDHIFYDGYTVLQHAVIADDGVSVMLKKEVTNDV